MTTKKENEQLVQLQTDICWIKKVLENHLHHHFLMTITAWGVTLTALVTLAIALVSQR